MRGSCCPYRRWPDSVVAVMTYAIWKPKHGGQAATIAERRIAMPDLPNGKKCPKLPENESILPERVKRWRKEREAFVKGLENSDERS